MTSAFWRNILRDIKNSKARFISIMLIVALGVGFFTGIKATSPSMNETAEQYYAGHNLMDYRILSTVGFSDKDVEEIKKLGHVRAASPSYFADVIVSFGGQGSVIRLYSTPEADENGVIINEPVVTEGRLPEKKGEIAVEKANFSGDFEIGDIVTVDEKISGEDTTDTINSLEYTIVGFIQSPLYVSYERGSTTVGSGEISLYGMICPEEFVSERYTQVYVLTDYSDGSIKTLEDGYFQAIEDLQPQFEQLGEERAGQFDGEYLIDARQKLDDAQEELDSEREKAEKELADAEKELNEGQEKYDNEIADAQSQLEDAKRQIENGESELEQGWDEYDSQISSAQNELDSTKDQLSDAQSQLDSAKKSYNSQIREAEKELNSAEREYNKGVEEYNDGVSELQSETRSARVGLAALQTQYELSKNKYENVTKPAGEKIINDAQKKIDDANAEIEKLTAQLETADDTQRVIIQVQINTQQAIVKTNQSIIDSEQAYLDEEEAKVNEDKRAFEEAQAQYNAALEEPQAQLNSAKEQLDNASDQISSGRSELENQKAQGQAALDSAQQQINDGSSQRTEGQQELSSAKTEGRQQLKDAEAQLEQAKEEYENGVEELERKSLEGQQQLDDARAEYESAKAEAEATIADAQSELDKARGQLEKLENPEWYIFVRTDNPGFQSLIDDTTRIDAVATVFPLFFLMVAALVCLTTLTRQVEEKRTEIGTLKALGYSNGAIKFKFVIYATAASLLGCVIGIILGMITLPNVIYSAYGIMYDLQELTLVMPWGIALAGAALAFACTTFVALYTCQKALSEKPASLMRPKSPKIGKRIFLERIPFLWNKMNFTSKVTARNIVRYKARFLMTVIGVAGCTALMLAGFGLKNSISSIASVQFEELNRYDLLAILDSDGTAHQKAELMSEFENDELIERAMLEHQVAIQVSDMEGENAQDNIYLTVPQSVEEMENFILLRERSSGEKIDLADNGVVITEKLADSLGVSSGDAVTLIDDHREYKVKVTGVAENYVSGYVYMSPEYFKEIYGTDARFNMVMARITEVNDENEEEIGSHYLDNSDIAAVSFISGSIESFNNTVNSLDLVILVLILCAGLLAIVVLYNLTNINIAERVREIATIKVLGFYDGETCAFVYRENVVLTLCGVIAGLGLGIILHRFVIITIEVNNVMFSRHIELLSYVYAALLTLLFAVIVNFVMYFKIKKIDMVESLKSIE